MKVVLFVMKESSITAHKKMLGQYFCFMCLKEKKLHMSSNCHWFLVFSNKTRVNSYWNDTARSLAFSCGCWLAFTCAPNHKCQI